MKFPPPVVFLLVIFAACGTHYVLPIPVADLALLPYIGAAVVILGLGMVFLASRYFARAATPIEPWKPTTTIISSGMYRYSRNPIYVAFCLIQIGIGLMLNSVWVAASFVVSAALVYYLAIRKEEAYLQAKFGADYIDYRNRVRRWL